MTATPFPTLFSPIQVGPREVENRILMTGMSAHMAPDQGWVTDREVAFYERRARGGVGYIVVGAAFVHPSGTFGAQLGIHSDEMIPGLARLASVIRRHGPVASIQLHHAGRQTNSAVTGYPLIAPSAIPCPVKQEVPRELSRADIEEAIEWYAEGARRAMEAGFDGIEVHGAHGYLPAQFLSSRANQRSDEYGGSLENRARFITRTVRRVREVVGTDIPLTVKISGNEFVDDGLTTDESPQIARQLEDAGADLVAASAGVAPYYFTVPNMSLPRGCFTDLARALKATCSIPISTVGRITTPELAEEILVRGDADVISMGRSLISDPDFPLKAREGREADICVCIGCNKGCHDPSRDERATACLLNPEAGFERELRMNPPADKQRVLVVGGGPGGLEAAQVAAHRGHDVILCEREPYWGGRLYLGTLAPDKEEYAVGVDYLVGRCCKHGVDMRLETAVTSELATELQPDVVVFAAGAEPLIPPIPGLGGDNIVIVDAFFQGRAEVGDRVVVLGGGAVGAEVAHMLAHQGHWVTVLEMLPHWGHGMPPDALWHMQRDFEDLPVEVIRNTIVTGISDGSVHAEQDGRLLVYSNIDTVVVAAGARPNNALHDAICAVAPQVEVIGDAIRPRSALEAIAEGSRVGRSIGGRRSEAELSAPAAS